MALTVSPWQWHEVKRHARMLRLLRRRVSTRGWRGLSVETYRGVHLGRWIARRRHDHADGTIPRWLARELEAIPGWTWHPRVVRQRRALELLRRYVARHGWAGLANETVIVEGVNLGRFISQRRFRRRHGRFIPRWVVKELESIPGWRWEPAKERRRAAGRRDREHQALLRQLVRAHGGSTEVVGDLVRIARWLHAVRHRHAEGTLSPALRRRVEALPGWTW